MGSRRESDHLSRSFNRFEAESTSMSDKCGGGRKPHTGGPNVPVGRGSASEQEEDAQG